MTNILKKYQNDLIRSRFNSSLIELNKKDLNEILNNIYLNDKKDNNLGTKLALTIAKNIYDSSLSSKDTTNIIFIDAFNKNEDIYSILVYQLLEQINDSLKKLYNLEIAKETINSVLAYTTKGLSSHFGINSYINCGIDFLVDEISSGIGNIISNDLIHYGTKEIIDFSLDEIKNKLHLKVIDKTINQFDNLENTKIHISNSSKVKLLENSKRFSNNLSDAELYQLIIKLIIDIAIDMPKLIFIKNPHKLDQNSISLLSLLISVSKSLKDENIHTGISILYAYDDEEFQPYSNCEEIYKEIKRILDEQRIFAQRYSILVRPSSYIPMVAVKSNIFVGRDEELKILRESYDISKNDPKKATMHVVAAEPGIGKTKLIKKHLELIRKEDENGHELIQLTILNSIGHNSINTGLGSLINSIFEESERLDNIKKVSQKIKDRIQKKVLDLSIDSIKDIFGDNIINTGKAIINRYNLNVKIKEISKINIDNNISENYKEEQFDKINKAILKLESIIKNSSPIILFIDDLQWIDETSAEYILNHFIQKFNVHIISSIRISDSNTILSQLLEKKTSNKFKIALLKKTHVLVDSKLNLELDLDKLMIKDNSQLESKRLDLKGFDKNNLTNLISKIIQGTKQQQEMLSILIIKTLIIKECDEIVNTLFAVEAINMICDEKFYNETEKLILKNDLNTKIPMKFNEEILDFEKKLNETFENLKVKYKDSFNHPSSEKIKQNFNLMAYAILEERLNILQIYFKDYGDAAVNTLLLSSLMGSSFSSSLMYKVIKSIYNSNEEYLKPLKYEFTKSSNLTLEQIHYDTIEDIYEIISRYLKINNAYVYRHSLLKIFLNNQLDYKLELLFKKDKIKSKDKLYQLILTEIDKEVYSIENNFTVLNKEYYQKLEFLLLIEYTISDHAIKNIFNDTTVYRYIKTTLNLIKYYNDIYLLEKSRKIFENSFDFLEYKLDKGYTQSELLLWFLAYSTITNEYTYTYKHQDNALELQKSLIDMFENLKNNWKDKFYELNSLLIREYFIAYARYTSMCIDLEKINDNLIEIIKYALNELKIAKTKIDKNLLKDIHEALESNLNMILGKGNISFNYDITDHNLINITNHFVFCLKAKKYNEIVNISKKIFFKLEKEYINDNLIWIHHYALFCYYISQAYEAINLINEAITFNLKAIHGFENLDKILLNDYVLKKRYILVLILIIYYYKKYKLLGEKEIYVKRAFNLFDEDKIFKEKYINLFHELTQITNNENLNNFLINNKIGRNEICQLCDSGKKYKKCCGKNISIN